MKRIAIALLLFGCAPSELTDSTSAALAPAGSDASFASHSVPALFAPGERVNVSVVAQNTGATPGVNDWAPGAYALYQQNTTFRATAPRVIVPTPVGASHDFRVVVTAPTTVGAHTFSARMHSLALAERGDFGETLVVPNVQVVAGRRPRWGCALASHDVPSTIAPDAITTVNVTVVNTGTADWDVGAHCLRTTNTVAGTFGASAICPANDAFVPGAPQGTPVGTGASHTFSFTIRAPATPGAYRFRRQMYEIRPWSQGGVTFFAPSDCVDLPVQVAVPTGPRPYDAIFEASASQLPTQMAPGERRRISVRMMNAGTATWPGDGTVAPGNTILRSVGTPFDRFGPTTTIANPAPVYPGASADYAWVITAPATPGAYPLQFQSYGAFTGAGYFGEVTSATIAVVAGAQRAHDADVSAVYFPIMSPLRPATFEVVMRNRGSDPWVAGAYALVSTGSPVNLFGTTVVPLDVDVPSGGSVKFSFAVRGPQNAGTFPVRFTMRHPDAAIGVFGDETPGHVLVLATCGNQQLDPNEQCDDGNTTGGDGCSPGCQLEP